MRCIITCLFLMFAATVLAQNGKCDSISWNIDRKLTWDDFKAGPDNSSIIAARTHYDFTRTWSARGYTLKTVMVCSFNPCLSWSKNKKSDYLLSHEQGHFDIAEYFRRLYYKRVAETTYTPSTISGSLKKIYRDILKECEQMQDKYDSQTNHSLKQEEQHEWLKNISALLDGTKQFDKNELVIDLHTP